MLSLPANPVPAAFLAATIPPSIVGIDAMATALNTLTFMFDRAAETMKRDDLAALQLAKLRQTLDLAYNKVQHVRKKFDAAKDSPEHLHSFADLARFPFA